jgi:hypothetical protein
MYLGRPALDLDSKPLALSAKIQVNAMLVKSGVGRRFHSPAFGPKVTRQSLD